VQTIQWAQDDSLLHGPQEWRKPEVDAEFWRRDMPAPDPRPICCDHVRIGNAVDVAVLRPEKP
jgi:hypothetical protein